MQYRFIGTRGYDTRKEEVEHRIQRQVGDLAGTVNVQMNGGFVNDKLEKKQNYHLWLPIGTPILPRLKYRLRPSIKSIGLGH